MTYNVNRYPAQGSTTDAKIPTILYYDESGTVRAAGAEAISEGIEQLARENHWRKAEW